MNIARVPERKLTRHLTDILIHGYETSTETRERMDGLLDEYVPDEIRSQGLRKSVSWFLTNSNATDLVREHLRKRA